MKRVFAAVCSFLFLSIATAWAQPKVAVLDAVVQKGIDSSVVVPVTDKVIERLVVSGRYTVLDRADIEQVLREREFQVSGFVSDAEVTEAGKYLGADFVVVIKVQKIETTYFLSAKMITVETGVISNQSSAEGEGKLSVLVHMAEEAGNILSGEKAQSLASDKAKEPEAVKSAPKPRKEKPAPSEEREKKVETKLYIGLGGGAQDLEDETGYSSYLPYGAQLYTIVDIGRGVRFIGDLAYQDSSGDFGPVLFNLDVGVGYGLALGILMPWAAARLGYSWMDWEEYWGQASAFEYGFDVGLDVKLGRFLVGVVYQYTLSTYKKFLYYDLHSTQNFFWLLGGYRL